MMLRSPTRNERAPEFDNLLGTDGREYSLSSFDDKQVLVLVFFGNGCPTCKATEPRLIALQDDYGPKGIQIVLINSNNSSISPPDTLEEMTKRARENGYNFPYLKDETGGLARLLNATNTPHAFVFDKERKLRYKGRVDNARQAFRVTFNDVRNVLDDLLSDGIVRCTETEPFGCSLVLLGTQDAPQYCVLDPQTTSSGNGTTAMSSRWTIGINLDRTSLSILGLIVVSWAVLIGWSGSQYSSYLGHSELGETATLTQFLILASAFLAGWALMIFAMMLPSALPFLRQFRLQANQMQGSRGLLVPLIAGFVSSWAAFGVAAYTSDLGIHKLAALPPLNNNTWLLGFSALALAALYEFTPTKASYLRDCCRPSDFIQSHWKRSGSITSVFKLGLGYGKVSLGSSWALMLLIFALELGSPVWMGILGGVMVAEESPKWGPKLSLLLSAFLISMAAYLFLLNLIR